MKNTLYCLEGGLGVLLLLLWKKDLESMLKKTLLSHKEKIMLLDG
jgi:hypothetical protein